MGRATKVISKFVDIRLLFANNWRYGAHATSKAGLRLHLVVRRRKRLFAVVRGNCRRTRPELAGDGAQTHQQPGSEAVAAARLQPQSLHRFAEAAGPHEAVAGGRGREQHEFAVAWPNRRRASAGGGGKSGIDFAGRLHSLEGSVRTAGPRAEHAG